MELLIDIERVEQLVNLFGNLDENIKKLKIVTMLLLHRTPVN